MQSGGLHRQRGRGRLRVFGDFQIAGRIGRQALGSFYGCGLHGQDGCGRLRIRGHFLAGGHESGPAFRRLQSGCLHRQRSGGRFRVFGELQVAGRIGRQALGSLDRRGLDRQDGCGRLRILGHLLAGSRESGLAFRRLQSGGLHRQRSCGRLRVFGDFQIAGRVSRQAFGGLDGCGLHGQSRCRSLRILSKGLMVGRVRGSTFGGLQGGGLDLKGTRSGFGILSQTLIQPDQGLAPLGTAGRRRLNRAIGSAGLWALRQILLELRQTLTALGGAGGTRLQGGIGGAGFLVLGNQIGHRLIGRQTLGGAADLSLQLSVGGAGFWVLGQILAHLGPARHPFRRGKGFVLSFQPGTAQLGVGAGLLLQLGQILHPFGKGRSGRLIGLASSRQLAIGRGIFYHLSQRRFGFRVLERGDFIAGHLSGQLGTGCGLLLQLSVFALPLGGGSRRRIQTGLSAGQGRILGSRLVNRLQRFPPGGCAGRGGSGGRELGRRLGVASHLLGQGRKRLPSLWSGAGARLTGGKATGQIGVLGNRFQIAGSLLRGHCSAHYVQLQSRSFRVPGNQLELLRLQFLAFLAASQGTAHLQVKLGRLRILLSAGQELIVLFPSFGRSHQFILLGGKLMEGLGIFVQVGKPSRKTAGLGRRQGAGHAESSGGRFDLSSRGSIGIRNPYRHRVGRGSRRGDRRGLTACDDLSPLGGRWPNRTLDLRGRSHRASLRGKPLSRGNLALGGAASVETGLQTLSRGLFCSRILFGLLFRSRTRLLGCWLARLGRRRLTRRRLDQTHLHGRGGQTRGRSHASGLLRWRSFRGGLGGPGIRATGLDCGLRRGGALCRLRGRDRFCGTPRRFGRRSLRLGRLCFGFRRYCLLRNRLGTGLGELQLQGPGRGRLEKIGRMLLLRSNRLGAAFGGRAKRTRRSGGQLIEPRVKVQELLQLRHRLLSTSRQMRTKSRLRRRAG